MILFLALKTMRAYSLTRATNHGLLLNTAHTPSVVPTPALIASTGCTPKIETWRNYLQAAGHTQVAATCLWLDNEANVKNMFNLSATGTQHLNKRQAYSRDMVARIKLRPEPIPGKSNCADALTKSLPTPAFTKHADKLLGIAHARKLRAATG